MTKEIPRIKKIVELEFENKFCKRKIEQYQKRIKKNKKELKKLMR